MSHADLFYNSSNNRQRRVGGDRLRKFKRRFLDEYGDGKTVNCALCGKELTKETVTVDKIKPGIKGGKYTWDNIQPTCNPCNQDRGGDYMLPKKFKERYVEILDYFRDQVPNKMTVEQFKLKYNLSDNQIELLEKEPPF